MRKIATGVLLVPLLILALSPCNAQEKESGLLAAPYPGSVLETHPGVTDPFLRKVMGAHGRTYYSKDAGDKVMAHYVRLSGGKFEVSPEGDHIFTLSVIPFNQVAAIITKRGGTISEGGESFWGGTMAGVTVYGRPKTGNANYSVTKVYESLEQAYALRLQISDPAQLQQHMQDPELQQARQKYEHLKTDYFMETDQKKKDAPRGTCKVDEVLYDKYYTSAKQSRQQELEQTQKKYTDALAKMNYDEATRLGNLMMKLSQPQPEDDWVVALKCLEEMEKNAYATKIVIDTHPSKWDLTPQKN
jgi:hypothetical protein